MGASRKLQGEIDKTLKKVQEGVDVFDSIWNKVYDTENANQKEKFEADLKKEIKKLQRYRDQIKTWIQSSEIKDKKALMESRKLIEREMERFKVCEKETKTKAFSKEGLGQQPKTDPKEKAKAECRDWLNGVVADLQSQIDNFEAEVEGLPVKKGKTRPPRLVHLEKSIVRHKAHIKRLESILRLLDNDELSPDEVNDVKDLLEDYVERNQDDFDEFSDVDELYSTLPPEKVEALEEMVSLGPSSLAKASLSTVLVDSSLDMTEETTSQDSNSDSAPRTPPPKSNILGTSVTSASPNITVPVITASLPTASVQTVAANSPRPMVGIPSTATILSVSANASTPEISATSSLPPVIASSVSKTDETMNLPMRKPSPSIPEVGLGLGITRGTQNLISSSAPISLISVNEATGAVPPVPDLSKRNVPMTEEKSSTVGLPPPPVSPLSNKAMLQQASRTLEGIGGGEPINLNGSTIIGARIVSPSPVSGPQWRTQTASSFQTQNELGGQLRGRPEIGRPEIAPDQREKFLQKYQQVQQQNQSNILSVPHIQGLSQKQFPVQQLNLGLGIQPPGITPAASPSLQAPPSLLQQSTQHLLVPSGTKDGDAGIAKPEEQQQPTLTDDLNTEPVAASTLVRSSDDEMKGQFLNLPSNAMGESKQLPRDTDLLPGQLLQTSAQSASVGVIGQRNISDLGSSFSGIPSSNNDQNYNLQLLEAAFHRLPQPKDSERVKSYKPRQPAVTPASYPQVQAPIISNPSFWERLGLDNIGSDVLFFAFYHQQNTYQQYLAARELKKQSWRYHRKYNTWFQRHSEPETTTDEFERGSYVYFDYHIVEEGNAASGWCQRIKYDFTFEYNYLEDELQVQQS